MIYKMFIDDERFPVGDDWIICRTWAEVSWYIWKGGCPSFISFDHDLGIEEPTGFDITKKLVEMDMDYGIFPADFDYCVHSQNPIGKANIEGLLNGYLNQRKCK